MIWSRSELGRQMKKMMRFSAQQTHKTVARVSYCCCAEKRGRGENVHSTPSDLIALSCFFWSSQRRRDHQSLTVDHMVPVLGRLTHRHKTLQAILLQLESIGCILTKNPNSFLLLLRIFSRAGMHAMLFQAYHQMQCYGFVPNTFARNLFMDALFRFGDLHGALTVFEQIQPPNFFTFDITLFHLSNLTTDLTQITHILRLMLRMHYYPNANTFHSFLNAFCKMNALLEAHQLWGLMVVLGIELSVNVCTFLIHKHCQVGRLYVATNLFQNMLQTGCSPNVVTYTTLIKALMESNMVNDAFHYLNMFSAGNTPDLVLCNVLIDCLSKAGRHQDAIEVFLRLSELNLQPDRYTFTSLLSMICQSRMFYLLPKLALVLRDVDADVVCCNALLSSLIKAGRPSLAVGFYDDMTGAGFAPDKYSFSGLLSALCAVGRIDQAVSVYRGDVMMYQEIDAHIHTVMIVELIKAGKYHMAATVFKLAVARRKYPLDNVAYAVGICALLRSGRTSDACTFYIQMKENGLKPNARTCNQMLFTFLKEKDLHKANQMLKEMIGLRIELSDRNFFNLCNPPYRSDAYFSTSNLLDEMRQMDLLSGKALHALSFDKYADSLEEKYEHCAEVNTEWNLVLDSSSSEDLSDVAASVG